MTSQAVLEPEHRARWGPICGVLFVVILAVSFFIFSSPNTDKSPQQILNYYVNNTHKREIGISTLLADLAVVLGIFWFGYLRDRFGRTDVGARFSPIMLAGAIIFASGGLMFSGAQLALIDSPQHLSADTAQTLNFLQSDIGGAAIVIGVSILMWAVGIIIFKTRILPRWLAWVSFLLALVALIGPIGFFAFLAMGIWILIVAFFMWRFEENLPVSGDVPERPVSGGTPG